MAALVTESEAEFAVLAEWHAWHPPFDKREINGLRFFQYLQRHRPHLLNFHSAGDKWQDVHCWLLHARCVKDLSRRASRLLIRRGESDPAVT